MHIAILASENLKNELLPGVQAGNNMVWVDSPDALVSEKADAFIDLLFEPGHVSTLQSVLPALVIFNGVEHTLSETDPSFVRINAWPTFLSAALIEASCPYEARRKQTEEAFAVFNKKIEWLPDLPGFVTPRIIAMIINEAFLALKEGVSTEAEIDTAMKLGTNYPYGPFEWAKKIGNRRVAALLHRLQKDNKRYTSFLPE